MYRGADSVLDSSDSPDARAASICAHVRALCEAGPDRQPGTTGNQRAVDYVARVLRDTGLEVELLPFEIPQWLAGSACAHSDGVRFDLKPGPYSAPGRVSGPLVDVTSADEISARCRPGCILLLHGDVARIQLTPRDYPWYSDPDHRAIYGAIEACAPSAVIAATGKNPAMTAALSPFPLIEDPAFGIPHAYTDEVTGSQLAACAGRLIDVEIDSGVRPSSGLQPIGRLRSDAPRPSRIIVAGHVDSKWGTTGAVDNAAGAATVLAVAGMLCAEPARHVIEFVTFNGEDHATSPGEVAYLAANPGGFSDVKLMINIDGAGLAGSRSAVSLYGGDGHLERMVDTALEEFPTIRRGEEWFASDHAIFAMRGVPCMALTCVDFERMALDIAHTPADTLEKVDCSELVRVASFVARVIKEMA